MIIFVIIIVANSIKIWYHHIGLIVSYLSENLDLGVIPSINLSILFQQYEPQKLLKYFPNIIP